MQWVSEKRWLFLFLSLLLISGFTLTSVISFQVSRSAIHDEISRNQLPLTGDSIYSEIQRDLLRPVLISSVIAQDAFLRDWVINGELDESRIRRFLQEIKDHYKTVTSFFVSEKTRTYYHSSGILKTVDPGDPRDTWYFRVRKMTPEFEINVDFDAANKDTMTIFVNYKVKDYQGNYIGAIGVGLTADAVGKLIDRYQKRFQRLIYFIDRRGDIILPRPAADKKKSNIRQIAGMKPFAERILKEESVNFRHTLGGQTTFVATRFIPELNWILIVAQSDAEAIGDLREALMVSLGISFLVTVIVLALTLFAINVHQRRLQEAARQERVINHQLNNLNRQKDKLLSIIGHDLRAPFTSLLGYAELLASKAPEMDKAQVSKYAEDVLKSGRNAQGLLDSLLNWARFQWEDLDPAPKSFDVSDTIRTNLGLFETIAQQKNIRLEGTDMPPIRVLADPHIADFLIRNLINNAIKFTPGGGSIKIDAVSVDGQAWISVSDTGIGIEADRLASIFDFDHDTSTGGTDGEVGIGMGLVLCREMVETHGGTIEIESEPGKGSTFRFSLPMDQDPGDAHQAPNSAPKT